MENYIKLLQELTLFNEQSFWDLLTGEDIFEIKRPKENIYVSVLGNAGIDAGLLIYRNAQELYSQLDLMENIANYKDQYARLEGIRVYLTGGKELADNMGIVKHLEEHHALNDIIVLVSNYGQQVRLPEEVECEELIHMIKQINAIQGYYRKNNLLPNNLEQWTMFSFSVLSKEVTLEIVEWPVYYSRKYDIDLLTDEKIQKIKTFPKDGKVGVGIYFLPTHNKVTNEFPSFCTLYDITRAQFLPPILLEQHQLPQLYELIVDALIEHHCYPQEFICTLPEVESMLMDMVDQLKIDTRIAKVDAIDELINYTMQNAYTEDEFVN